MTLSRLGLSLLLCCLACGGSERSQSPRQARPSILLISIDTLRADHLGCYGYSPYGAAVSPAIDVLASEGVRFTQFFTARGQTSPSLCSMLIGRYPSSHGVRDNGMNLAAGEQTLCERLNDEGYETAAFVSRIPTGPNAHPARGAKTLRGGERHPDGQPTRTFHEADEVVLNSAIEWLGRQGAQTEQPFFLWVHFYAVHKPYAPPPPYDSLFTENYSGELRPEVGVDWSRIERAIHQATLTATPLAPADHAYIVGLYDGGIRTTDARVERLLCVLDERELARETLVLLTADHGEELGDHQQYYFHGNSVYDSTLRIPLLMRWPGKLAAGTTCDLLAQNVDLVPTLLDWLGLPIGPELEGVSLAPWLSRTPPQQPPREHVLIEWQDLIWGARDREHHYLINPRGVWLRKSPYDEMEGIGFRLGCAELYDLRADPLQGTNVVESATEVAQRLRAVALAHRARPSAIRDWDGAEPNSLDQLQALGYVGSLPGREDVLFGAENCGEER